MKERPQCHVTPTTTCRETLKGKVVVLPGAGVRLEVYFVPCRARNEMKWHPLLHATPTPTPQHCHAENQTHKNKVEPNAGHMRLCLR